MNALFARLRLWFYRYFIGYGEYRYARSLPYYRSRRMPARPPLRSVPNIRPALHSPTAPRTVRRPPSRGVA